MIFNLKNNKDLSEIKLKDKFNLVGTKIKEFSLPNSRGETINIRNFENKKNVVVVLFRDIN